VAKILISIDHKWRDLPGYIYLGSLLEKKGHVISYCRNGLEQYYVAGFKPDLIIINQVHDIKRQEFAQKLAKMNILVCILPTEGIPTLSAYREFAGGVQSNLSGVEVHYVWNQPMKDILISNNTIPADKIEVVGVPRFDFYRSPLHKVLITKKAFCEKYNINSKLPIVTFATNFTQATFHVKNQEFLDQDSKILGYDKIMNKLHGGVSNIARSDFQSREILLDAFSKLMREMPKVNFVLKLHPSEDQLYYGDRFKYELKKYEGRFTIIGLEYIWDILNVTDVELKRSCTTGVEAWVLGIPTIEMKLNPEEWYYSEEHASGSDVVQNYHELKILISQYLLGSTVKNQLLQKREEFLQKWCFKIDGRSTMRLADSLHILVNTLNAKKKYTLDYKSLIIYYLLKFSRLAIHDIKVYGFLSWVKGIRIDFLGREDKHHSIKDIHHWKEILHNITVN
jgi:surface carbohydrate biosynthesis protein